MMSGIGLPIGCEAMEHEIAGTQKADFSKPRSLACLEISYPFIVKLILNSRLMIWRNLPLMQFFLQA